jgi:hypothetical protein
MVVALRRHTLLPLDDCLDALQPTILHLTQFFTASLFTTAWDIPIARYGGANFVEKPLLI